MSINKSKESAEKAQKSNGDIYSRFIKEFVAEVKSDNFSDNERNKLIKEICKKDEITSEIKKKLLKFQSDTKGTEKDFLEIDIEKINFFDLKRGFTKDFVNFQNIKSNYIANLTRNYELSTKELENIKIKLDEKNIKEIKILDKDIKKTKDFLENDLKIKLKEYDFKNIFNSLSEKEIENRLNKLEKNKKAEAESSLGQFASGNYTENDFRILFETGFLNKEEKIFLLKKYNSAISLKNAVDFGLLTIKESNEKIKQIVNKTISNNKQGIKLKDEELKLLTKEIDYRDIKVDILELNLSEQKIDKFVLENNGLDKLKKEIQDFKDEISENNKKIGGKNIKEFKEILETNYKENIEDLGLFEKGNYLRVSRKSINGNFNESFYEIISNDNKNSGFQLKLVGDSEKGVNLNSASEGETFLYSDIISSIEKTKQEKSKIRFSFSSKEDFRKEVKNPNSNIKESDFTGYQKEDIKDENIKNHFKGKLENQIEDLKNEIKNAEDDKEKTEELKTLLENKEYRLKKLNTLGDNSEQEDLSTLNKEKLIDDIDSIDSAGIKFGLQKGLFLEGPEGGIAEIYDIDNEKEQIIVKQGNNIIPVSFSAFYEGFKKHELKRVKKYNNFSEFLDGLKEKSNLSDYFYQNGKFLFKDKGMEKELEVEYFATEDKKKIVKIESIDSDKITITQGDRTVENDNKKGKKIIHSMQNNSETMTLNEFKVGILEKKMLPNEQIGKKEKELIQEENKDRHGSFGSRFLNRLAISDILAAGKMFIDNIEDNLKRGSDAASARLALKWGKYLPDDLRHSLQIKVESFESEEMDKALTGLGKIDSADAVKKVRDWVLNIDAPDYKIEAGMLFMLDKYGNLTAKGPMYPYRGKFIWYEALGGRVGDEFYNEMKEEAERGKNSFSEETLVLKLLKAQCKGNGYRGKKRRSRLYKELEGKMGNGIKSEIEKGHDDASKKTNVQDMLDLGNSELIGGTTANAIGGYKKVIEKGGSLEQMSEGFFTMLYSGDLYNVPPSLFNEIRGIFLGGKPIILAEMCRDTETITNTRKVILDLSKIIEKKYGSKYAGIAKEAEEIYNDATSMTGDASKKTKRTIDFFRKYGTPIIRALNLANSGDSEFGKTDKIIFFEKDNNPNFKKYYDNVKEITSEVKGVFGEDSINEACGEVGISGLNVKILTGSYLGLSQAQSFSNKKPAGRVWKEISQDIKATPNKIFDGGVNSNSDTNQTMQKKYLLDVFRQLLSGMRNNHSGDPLSGYDKVGSMGPDLRSWGLTPIKDNFEKYSPEGIMKGDADGLLNEAIDNILSGNIKIENDTYDDALKNSIDNTKDFVNNTID